MENETLPPGSGGFIDKLNSISIGTQFFIVLMFFAVAIVFTKQKDVSDMGMLIGTSYAAYMTGKAQQIINGSK